MARRPLLARARLSVALFICFCLLRGGACLEFLDASGGVHELRVACVEGGRRARYFDVEDGELLAVLPLVGLRGRDGGRYQKALPCRGILKNDRPVACRMNVFFHVAKQYHMC